MRISDWSSDVCASDLDSHRLGLDVVDPHPVVALGGEVHKAFVVDHALPAVEAGGTRHRRADRRSRGGRVDVVVDPDPADRTGGVDDHGLEDSAIERPAGAPRAAGRRVAVDEPVGLVFAQVYALTVGVARRHLRSEEHTSELQSLMRNSYAVFCLKKKTK